MESNSRWRTKQLRKELDKRGITWHYSTRLPHYNQHHDTIHFWVGIHDFCVTIDNEDKCLWVDSSAFPSHLAKPELRSEIRLPELLGIIDKIRKGEKE